MTDYNYVESFRDGVLIVAAIYAVCRLSSGVSYLKDIKENILKIRQANENRLEKETKK